MAPGAATAAPRGIRGPRAGAGELRIGSAEHALLIGQSQSGKTSALKELLWPVRSRIIIDTKRRDYGPEWGIVTSDPAAVLYHDRVVWQPDIRDVWRGGPPERNPFTRGLLYIYEHRTDPGGRPSVVVALDEARHTAPTNPNEGIILLVCSGMGKGAAVWAGTQNPYGIFGNLISDAVHVLSWWVQSKRDRSVLANNLGVDAESIAQLDPESHEFLYWRQGAPSWAGPLKFPDPKGRPWARRAPSPTRQNALTP